MNLRAICVLALTGAAPLAAAQSYPTKPIRLIAPSAPASVSDIRARWVANNLTPVLGQPIVVDNRSGAGGNIGTEAAAKSAPDGYTLAIVHHGTMAINPHIYARAGYHPVTDFAPVTRLASNPLMLAVNVQLPAQSVTDLLKLARDKPGQLLFGSPGIGTPPHVAAELFRHMARIDVVHVPYKGGAQALNDLVGGRVAYTIDNAGMQLPQVKAGKLRALAVTGAQRIAAAPDVPTLSEAGLKGYEYMSWMGVAAPAGTPQAIISRLHTELGRALKTPAAQEWYAAQGSDVVGDLPAEFAAVIRAEFKRWGPIVREARIKVE